MRSRERKPAGMKPPPDGRAPSGRARTEVVETLDPPARRPGSADDGDSDGFVSTFSADGTRREVERIGTPEQDDVEALAADGNEALYLCGETGGDLGGESNGGATDAFVMKMILGDE